MPVPAEERSRRRVLSIWAAISTPLVLIWLVLLVLPLNTSLLALSIGALLVICTIEAIARRALVRFLIALVIFTIVVLAGLALSQALVTDWRLALSSVLVIAAAIVLVANFAELRRD